MKKLIPFMLCIALAAVTHAQGSFTVTTVPCNNDGVLSVTFPGTPAPPYTVVWATEGTSGTNIIHTDVTSLTDDLTGYSGGPLTVTFIDEYGAVAGYSYYIGMPPLTISVTNTTLPCPSYDSIWDAISGGTGPYTSVWYNVNTLAVVGSGTKLGLPQGTYGVMVTDAHGCTYGAQDDPSVEATLSETPSFTVGVATTTAGCTNGTVAATVVGGGYTPYNYVWTNGATTPMVTGLVTGTYDVTVTDSMGCTALGTGFVAQSTTVSVPVSPSSATCSDSDGAATALASGGTAPYTYSWSNGATGATQTGLPTGYYSVNVMDANGCQGVGAGYVNTTTTIQDSTSSLSSLCTGPTGTATVYPYGGTTPYSIEWYTWPARQTTATAVSLGAGEYVFKITDATGCTHSDSVLVNGIDNINLVHYITQPVCGAINGAVALYPMNGVAPYHYSWNTGATTSFITAVAAGAYSVTVTDALSCTTKEAFYLSPSSAVGLNLTITPESCLNTNDGSIKATPWGGTAPYIYSWTGGGTTSTISSLPAGYYWLKVTDIHGCPGAASTALGYDTLSSCFCTIAGRIFHDLNGDCIQEAGEPGIANAQINISGIGYTYTNDSGYYSMPVPSGSYTVTETVNPYYPLSSCQLNNIPVTTSAYPGCSDTVNFANSIDTIHDMHISTWDYNQPATGKVYTQVTLITNHGTLQEDSVLATYAPDGQLPGAQFAPQGIFNGSPNYYTTAGGFPAIAPGMSQTVYMNYDIPENMPSGTTFTQYDTVAYLAPLTNYLFDQTPWDNVCSHVSALSGNSTGNFKEVNPQGTGASGLIPYTDSILEFMVHFQNTNSNAVENVVIVDTLSNTLNYKTLVPEYMSAPCQVTVTPAGAYQVVRFTFSNINLSGTGSSNATGNGMLTYTIHTMPGLAAGTQFTNSASVYFDYFAPVKTNTTLNTLQSTGPSSVTNVGAGKNNTFSIYPNPASGTFNAVINSQISGNATIIVNDITGKTVMTKEVSLVNGAQVITADASMFTPGVYFVSLTGNGATLTQKLVVMH